VNNAEPRTCRVDCQSYFNNSLFVVGEFGGNDYNAPLFGGKAMAEVRSYVPQIVDRIASGVEVRIICNSNTTCRRHRRPI